MIGITQSTHPSEDGKVESWNGGIRVDEYGIKKKKY